MSTPTSHVLKELTEFKKEYVNQYFQFTEGQRVRYTELLNKRRDIIKNWYDNDRVQTSFKVTKKEVK